MVKKIKNLATLLHYLCHHNALRLSAAYFVIFLALVIRGDGIMANHSVVTIQNGTLEEEIDELEEPPPTNRTNVCQISATEFTINFYIQTSICFVGFVLNMINVAVFLQPKFSGAAYAYMTAMSLADAITLLNNLPSGLLRCAGQFPLCSHPTFRTFRTGVLYYNTYVLFPVGNISEAASVWFTVLLSVDRYMAMRKLGISFRGHCKKEERSIDSLHQRKATENSSSAHFSEETFTRRFHRRIWRILYTIQRRICQKPTINVKCVCPRCCKYISYRHSICTVTVLSIIFSIPLFFVQTVREDTVPYRNTTRTSYNNISIPLEQPMIKLSTKFTAFGNSKIYTACSWIRTILFKITPTMFLCVANFCLFRFIKMASLRRRELLIQPVPSISATTTVSQQSQERAVVHRRHHKQASHKANMRDPCTNGGSSARWQMAQRKLTILLVVIVALFLAGQIPQAFAFANIFKVFGEVCACCQPYLIFRAITHTLSLFTYGVNFFVYLILNKHFKNQLTSWISLLCPRCFEKHLNVPTKTIITASQTQPMNRSHWLWLRPRLAITSTGPLRDDIPSNCHQLLSPPEFPSEAVSAPVAFERYRNELVVSDCYLNPRVRMGIRRPVSSHCDNRLDDMEVNIPVRNFYSAPGIKYRDPVDHNYDPMASAKPNAFETDRKENLLSETSCFTENFGRKHTQSAKTSYTQDSVLWNATDNHNRSEATVELTPTNHSGQLYSKLFHFSHIYPSIGGSFNPTICRNQIEDIGDSFRSTSINPKLYSEMNRGPNQESGRSYLSIESCSSFSNAFPPLVYQESDFDVISVDESLEMEHKILDTAI